MFIIFGKKETKWSVHDQILSELWRKERIIIHTLLNYIGTSNSSSEINPECNTFPTFQGDFEYAESDLKILARWFVDHTKALSTRGGLLHITSKIIDLFGRASCFIDEDKASHPFIKMNEAEKRQVVQRLDKILHVIQKSLDAVSAKYFALHSINRVFSMGITKVHTITVVSHLISVKSSNFIPKQLEILKSKESATHNVLAYIENQHIISNKYFASDKFNLTSDQTAANDTLSSSLDYVDSE